MGVISVICGYNFGCFNSLAIEHNELSSVSVDISHKRDKRRLAQTSVCELLLLLRQVSLATSVAASSGSDDFAVSSESDEFLLRQVSLTVFFAASGRSDDFAASSESDDFCLRVEGATTHQKICVVLFSQGHQCRVLELGTF
ncbi:hypothetical protein TNCV_4140131 [Trichonephila clavipes]|nr:hypothetical protein TNCV_4140131 [Trichonephila clavipes]